VSFGLALYLFLLAFPPLLFFPDFCSEIVLYPPPLPFFRCEWWTVPPFLALGFPPWSSAGPLFRPQRSLLNSQKIKTHPMKVLFFSPYLESIYLPYPSFFFLTPTRGRWNLFSTPGFFSSIDHRLLRPFSVELSLPIFLLITGGWAIPRFFFPFLICPRTPFPAFILSRSPAFSRCTPAGSLLLCLRLIRMPTLVKHQAKGRPL